MSYFTANLTDEEERWQRMEVPVAGWLVEEPIGGSTGIRHVGGAEFADTYQPADQSGEASP